jgi:hypothetical protein
MLKFLTGIFNFKNTMEGGGTIGVEP